MALQRINWTQIDTETVTPGTTIDLGSSTTPLNAVYADNLYVSGTSLTDLTTGSSGTSGSSGLSGTSGSSGSSGSSGARGTSGTSGTSGSSGNGTSGTSGSSGQDGINGSNVYIENSTGDLIIEVINMQDDEEVEVSIMVSGDILRDTI